MKDFILGKLREKSTWVGLAGLIASLSFLPFASQVSDTIMAAGGLVVSVLAIWYPETTNSDSE